VAVIPRESGGSSTPRLLDAILGASEYWIARSSRAATTETVIAIKLNKRGVDGRDEPGHDEKCRLHFV
jgi:hypothetical protein